MTKLPKSGRTGRAPAWPLDADLKLETAIHAPEAGDQVDRGRAGVGDHRAGPAAQRRKLDRANRHLAELEAMKKFLAKNERKLWADLWKTPQATQWEKLGWTREVAQYVRHKVKAEGGLPR
jgi:hypothetical protein